MMFCSACYAADTLAGDTLTSNDILEKANKVNRQVNSAISYSTDQSLHGVADYWATPAETLASEKGDCEDYVILKRAMLAKQGILSRLGYAVLSTGNNKTEKHMVLLVDVAGEHYVLDNYKKDVIKLQDRQDLSLVVSFDDVHVYVHGKMTKLDIKALFPQIDVLKKDPTI